MNDKMGMTEKEIMKSLDMARSRLKEAEKDVMKYVKKDPGKAMMIAAGVGAAIGAVLTLAIEEDRKREDML